jgi:hypothetical protein
MFHKFYAALAEKAKKDKYIHSSHSIDAAIKNHKAKLYEPGGRTE